MTTTDPKNLTKLTPAYIKAVKRRVWEIHIRDHDKHIRREDLNAVLAGVDYVLEYYEETVAALLAALGLAKDHSELEDEVLDIVDAAISHATA